MKSPRRPSRMNLRDLDLESANSTSRPLNARSLKQKEIDLIARYLENPTHAGVWQLTFPVRKDAPFCVSILSQLEKRLKGGEAFEITSGRGKVTMRLDDEKKRELESVVTRRLTFHNTLFLALHQSTLAEAKTLDNLFTGDSAHEVILQLLDLPELRKSLQGALEYFQKNILYDRFQPKVERNELFFTKNGFMLLLQATMEDEAREFKFLSCDSNGLRQYAEFLRMSGRIHEYNLMPIFSPEQQVFAPYFALLRASAPSVIKDVHVKQLFGKAFSEYEGQSYTNCISTIGLIAEDYLTQVFETMFREVCPKGMTLGQLYEYIHSQILKKYGKPEKDVKELSTLYSDIIVT